MASIEFIARAVIEEEGKILLCRSRGAENWYFPGGHIEEGESAPDALLRELSEELGVTGQVRHFLGASENKFIQHGRVVQEVNLVFDVILDEEGAHESKEAHLEFAWFALDEMEELLVFPLSLRDEIIASHKRKDGVRALWASEGFKE